MDASNGVCLNDKKGAARLLRCIGAESAARCLLSDHPMDGGFCQIHSLFLKGCNGNTVYPTCIVFNCHLGSIRKIRAQEFDWRYVSGAFRTQLNLTVTVLVVAFSF